MNQEEIIKQVKNILEGRLPTGYRFVLFGSFAKGGARETSDMDIGILGPEEVPWSAMAKILNEIDNIKTLRKIDVVDLRASGKRFMENVLTYAKTL